MRIECLIFFYFQSGVTLCLPGWKHDFNLREVIEIGKTWLCFTIIIHIKI